MGQSRRCRHITKTRIALPKTFFDAELPSDESVLLTVEDVVAPDEAVDIVGAVLLPAKDVAAPDVAVDNAGSA